MNFKECLIEQLNTHVSIKPRDVMKMCYQGAFGAEHLLFDLGAAQKYFYEEFSQAEERDCPIFENISDSVSRINFSGWKKANLPPQWLFKIFVESAKNVHDNNDNMELFEALLDMADKTVQEGYANFSVSDWLKFKAEYIAGGVEPIHHSKEYRDGEKPAYRIVDRRYTRLIPILVEASKRPGGVIVIDGFAASGKSTMAKQLAEILGGSIVRIDDFFLPTELRTEERLAETGGNVHYERFKAEVIENLSKNEEFEYRRFDCSKMDYGEYICVPAAKWRIVEGSYSHHPYFGKYGDIRVFSVVDSEEQMRRIVKRNGKIMAERFEKLWIPMENKYFQVYNIGELAELRV